MPKQKWPILTRKGGLTTEKQHVVLSYKVPVQHSLLLVYYFHLEFRISNRLVIGFRVGKCGHEGCISPKILTPTGSVASPNSKMKVAVACKSQKMIPWAQLLKNNFIRLVCTHLRWRELNVSWMESDILTTLLLTRRMDLVELLPHIILVLCLLCTPMCEEKHFLRA